MEIVPQLGTFVTLISPQAVADASVRARGAGVRAVALAAQRADAEAVEQLSRTWRPRRETHDRAAISSASTARRRVPPRSVRAQRPRDRLGAQPPRQRPPGPRPAPQPRPAPDYMREMIDEHHAVLAAVAARKPAQGRRRRCATTCGWFSRASRTSKPSTPSSSPARSAARGATRLADGDDLPRRAALIATGLSGLYGGCLRIVLDSRHQRSLLRLEGGVGQASPRPSKPSARMSSNTTERTHPTLILAVLSLAGSPTRC